jgi:hypothetical protein
MAGHPEVIKEYKKSVSELSIREPEETSNVKEIYQPTYK